MVGIVIVIALFFVFGKSSNLMSYTTRRTSRAFSLQWQLDCLNKIDLTHPIPLRTSVQ